MTYLVLADLTLLLHFLFILIVTVGGEENDEDCDLGDPSASAFFGADEMSLASSTISGTEGWRACSARRSCWRP